MKKPKKLRESVEFIGQKYIDEPVREEVSKAKVTSISVNIGLQGEFNKDTPRFDERADGPTVTGIRDQSQRAGAWRFGEVAPAPVAVADVEAMVIAQVLRAHSGERKLRPVPPLEARIEEFVGHERVFFRWVTPDGNGGLKPTGAT